MKPTQVDLELTFEYHLEDGPTRRYRTTTSFFKVRNIRLWLRGPDSWQAGLSGIDTVTGKPIGTPQIVGDDMASPRTRRWLAPYVEDAKRRYSAALKIAEEES